MGLTLARADESETIRGNTYQRIEGVWFVRDAVTEELWELAVGIITVRFVPDAPAGAIDTLARLNGLVATQESVTLPFARSFQYDASRDPIRVLKNVLSSAIVDNAILDTYLKFHSEPNDEYYQRQWNLVRIGLERAWDITNGDPSVTIAIIDKGVQSDHEDLAGSTWHNPGETVNGIDDDGNGFVDDIVGWDFIDQDNDPRPREPGDEHGTSCAGVAAAVSNNVTGIAGVASGCRLVHVRVDSQNDAALAVNYCRKTGVDVISMSWAASASSFEALGAEIDTAYAHGAVLLASAGNSFGPPVFPASHPLVIAVGGTDINDMKPADGSNNGEVMAPTRFTPSQVELWTTDNDGSFNGSPYPDYNPGPDIDCACPSENRKYYHNFGRTSAACPTVAGIAGLLLSHEPNLTNVQVRELIRRGAVDVCAPGVDEECGYGRVDAYRSLTKWGTIDENTTWSGTVYVSGDVVVASNATLTIEPGTIVRIAADDNENAGNDSERIELNIEGRLVAIGTLANPIVFESWTSTTTPNWIGFYFDDQSDGGKFTRCKISDAEYAIESHVALEVRYTTFEDCHAGVVSYTASAFVKDCTITSSGPWGIYVSGADATIRNSVVSNASIACLYVQPGSSLVARGSQFANGGTGLLINGSPVMDIDSLCAFSSNGVGIYCYGVPSSVVIKNSTINSNSGNGIRCDTSSHPLIQNNTVRYNALGIYCTNFSSPTIKGNMIKSNTYGVSAATGANPDIGTYPSSGGNTIAFSYQKHAVNWNEFEIKAENTCWDVNTGDCYPPPSKIQGLVDTDYPECCTTMAGAAEFTPDPEPEKAPTPNTDLVGVVPNPFNPSSTIHYSLADQERVRIVVYDVAGRSVRDLVDRAEQPGSHTAFWDGTNAKGTAVASGVYFVRFSAGPVSRTMKMILVK